ncbi:MAG: hypothetical protein RR891_05290 [Clostridium sp.]|uniref:hypothetical protein n=1 Tax=Clostridium sp. TaxID=1506 RepID=UPI003066C43C
MKKNKLILGVIISGVILVGGKFSYDNFIKDDSFTHTLTYISIQGNEKEKNQINEINRVIKSNECKYEEIDFNMLKVDEENNVVIKESEYNKLAKKKGFKEVDLNDNDTMIIPRYDGLKNTSYIKELKEVKEYSIDDLKLNAVGVTKNKILVEGMFKNQLIIDDSVYNKLLEDIENKSILIKGFDIEDTKKSKLVSKELKSDKLFEKVKNEQSYFILSEY